ncbi:hypothetical protein PR003_g17190 [Phytophthora rubi]|uniref:Uncharacterized protein n=1 Tax=Phytophthora rubi TaxID=129364 RepID=A0A6A3MEL8_9STRA|nr:hypothetical protein PR002_g12005 [Phytophthora rubi]KAE9028478.1 hypothetical protein PR001_g11729 [Phytophthora rubi]KAE9322610.1 hypothetical protein PR003_g17190 [Phytophthora rubi]
MDTCGATYDDHLRVAEYSTSALRQIARIERRMKQVTDELRCQRNICETLNNRISNIQRTPGSMISLLMPPGPSKKHRRSKGKRKKKKTPMAAAPASSTTAPLPA